MTLQSTKSITARPAELRALMPRTAKLTLTNSSRAARTIRVESRDVSKLWQHSKTADFQTQLSSKALAAALAALEVDGKHDVDVPTNGRSSTSE